MTRRTKGIIILLFPVIIITGIFISFIVVNTLLGTVPTASLDIVPQVFAEEAVVPAETTAPAGDSIVDVSRLLINYVLGFLGVLTFFAFFLCVPLGLYYIFTSDHKATDLRQYSELQNLSDEQLKSVDRLSWGAFFGGFIWPLSTGLYLWALACFIPFVNIYVYFKLWIHGRRMSYLALQPTSFEEFQERQRNAAMIILLFYVFTFALYFFLLYWYIFPDAL